MATHFGLHVFADGKWSRRSADRNDHMGFSLTPLGMWRSGHPSGGGSLGVQESPDAGRSWITLSAVAQPAVDFHAMTASRADPPTMYGWDSGGRGLFRSIDGGKQWDPTTSEGLPRVVGALAASKTPGAVYATGSGGLYRSEDGAASWRKVSDEALFALCAAGDPEMVYGGRLDDARLVRSTDGGVTWQPLEPAVGRVVALAASPDGRTVIAAEESAQVWRSTDGGQEWTKLPMP